MYFQLKKFSFIIRSNLKQKRFRMVSEVEFTFKNINFLLKNQNIQNKKCEQILPTLRQHGRFTEL